jgi:hypothetical protein
LIVGVGNQQARFSDSTITDDDKSAKSARVRGRFPQQDAAKNRKSTRKEKVIT